MKRIVTDPCLCVCVCVLTVYEQKWKWESEGEVWGQRTDGVQTTKEKWPTVSYLSVCPLLTLN